MSFSNNIKTFFKIGFINTFRMNLKYFGLKGVFKQYILCAKHLKIVDLRGQIKAECALKRGLITIGFTDVNVFDKKYERAMWQNSGVISVKGAVRLGQGFRLVNTGKLDFNGYFRATANSTVICYKHVSFGDGVLVAWNSLIMDDDGHKIYSAENNALLNAPSEITVGDNVWICSRTLILKGSRIANGCVLSACSTLSGAVTEENCLIGDRGKILKRDIRWEE